jgi:hypothetical protein
MESTDRAIAILEKIRATDLKAKREEMESESKHPEETNERMEEAAQGPASSCKATRRAEGTIPRSLSIPEEVGCRLQEGIPSCSNGTAQGKVLQENSNPGKLWTAKGIGRSPQEDDPSCRSGTAQGTQA